MFFSPKIYLRDKWIAGAVAVILACQLFMWIYTLLNIHPTVEQIFLHYNVIFGVDLVGDWWKIFYTSILGLVIALVNIGLSLWFYGRDRLFGRFLPLAAAVFNILAAIGLYLVVGLNI